jgi:DNA-binding HxlR family transcriptional regulator
VRSYGQFCPISKAAEVFCERWTPLILRDLGKGVSRFSELQRGVARASPTLLSRRLRELEAEGLLERRRPNSGRGWTYHLTAAGQDLMPLVHALGVWGQKWSRRELMDHELDAGLLLWAMERGSHPDAFGTGRSVVQLTFRERPARWRHYWFVAENGATQLCIMDPGFEVDLYLTTTLRDMIYIWRGDLPLDTALSQGRLEAIGKAQARSALPRWLARSRLADVKSERPTPGIANANGRRRSKRQLENNRIVRNVPAVAVRSGPE